eukprot:EC825888.1.p1 GENE.EC825888.1~~EC825888.1.p1  ORF type:complete len:126 (+),score=26.42 EC825888.1:14-391(+)
MLEKQKQQLIFSSPDKSSFFSIFNALNNLERNYSKLFDGIIEKLDNRKKKLKNFQERTEKCSQVIKNLACTKKLFRFFLYLNFQVKKKFLKILKKQKKLKKKFLLKKLIEKLQMKENHFVILKKF